MQINKSIIWNELQFSSFNLQWTASELYGNESELQDSYLQWVAIIWNKLQWYTKKKIKLQKCGVQYAKSTFIVLHFFYFQNFFIKLLLLFVLLKLYKENCIFYSLLFRDIICLDKLFIFLFPLFFLQLDLLDLKISFIQKSDWHREECSYLSICISSLKLWTQNFKAERKEEKRNEEREKRRVRWRKIKERKESSRNRYNSCICEFPHWGYYCRILKHAEKKRKEMRKGKRKD